MVFFVFCHILEGALLMDAFELIQAVLAVPAAGSVLLILLGQQRIAVSRAISVGVTGLMFLLSVRLAALTELQGGFVQSAGLALQVDRIGALLLLAFSGVAFAVSLFASQLLEKEINENSVSHYYSVFFLLLAGLMGTATVSDLLGMYLCLEVVMLTAAFLVAAKGDASARQASAKYLVLNLCGSVLLLTGLIGIYRLTGQSNLLKLGKAMPNAVALHSTSMRAFTALVVAGLAVKSALFPLHTWLPDAHGSSATPSSVVISGLLVKSGIVFIIRFMGYVLPMEFIQALPLQEILLLMSGLAILGGSVMALRQTDIKRMLAYSTVAQVGYIFLGLGLMAEKSLIGAVYHILNHAVVKGMLVLAAGSIMKLTGRRRIADFAGVGRRFPLPMAVFTVGALSMIGVPPLSGFVSKWYLGLGALEAGMPVFVVVLLISSVLNALYYLPIVIAAFFRPGSNIEQHMELPVSAKVAMVLLAVACVGLGLAAHIPVEFIRPAVQQFLMGGTF